MIFSLVNRLIVGMVRLAGSNESGVPIPEEDGIEAPPPPTEFDVTIMIFGLNDTAINYDPSMIINPDQQYGGVMEPYGEFEVDQLFNTELYDNNKRDALEVEEQEELDELDELDEDQTDEDIEEHTEGPFTPTDHFDKNPDKTIEIGQRQSGKLGYDVSHGLY